MTLVILGLLLGLVEIVWVMVLEIVQAASMPKADSRHFKELTGSRHESKAA